MKYKKKYLDLKRIIGGSSLPEDICKHADECGFGNFILNNVVELQSIQTCDGPNYLLLILEDNQDNYEYIINTAIKRMHAILPAKTYDGVSILYIKFDKNDISNYVNFCVDISHHLYSGSIRYEFHKQNISNKEIERDILRANPYSAIHL